jgi:predicted nucleic acid-binding Zn ribbon protein
MSEYICPHCKNPISDDEALLCLYCGESLGRRKGSKLIIIVVVGLILLSFIALLINFY